MKNTSFTSNSSIPSIEAIRQRLGSAKNGRYNCPICFAAECVSCTVGENGKPLVHCFHRKCDVWGHLRKGGAPARVRPKEDDGESPAQLEHKRLLRAHHILREARRANAGKPDAYLRARGITIMPNSALFMPANVSADVFGDRFPAMIVPIVDRHGTVKGAQVTTLDRDGTKRIAKRTYGLMKGNYAHLGPVDADRPLIVGEGIETVLSAMQLTGYAGIATLGTEFMELVNLPACSEVIIAADRGKAGQKAAKVLGERVASRGIPVRIATPRDDDDWNDELQFAKGNLDILARLKRQILRAPLIEAPDYSDLTSFSMAEFINADVPPQSYLVKPIMLNGHSTMLTAAPGAGKTRLSLSIAYSVATGTDLMEWTIPKSQKALYIDAELGAATMISWLQRLGPPSENLRIISDNMNFLHRLPRVTLATEEGRAYLMREIKIFNPKLVILDALMTLIPIEMTEGKVKEDHWPEVERFIARLKSDGRHVLLLHHDNKSGMQYGSMTKTIKFDFIPKMESMEPTPENNKDGKWAFRLLMGKPRHLTPDQGRSRIITATAKGDIEWEMTNQSAEVVRGRRADPVRDKKVLEMYDSDDYKLREIADEVGLSVEGVNGILRRHGRKSVRKNTN